LFVAVASIGFSVSGQVYTEIRDNGSAAGQIGTYFYIQEPWSEGAVTPLDDLRCGRQGTGVDLNFDSFTLTYKLRDQLSGVQGLNQLASGVTATSPGYLQISGIKAGPVDLAIGVSWWGAFTGNNTLSTNTNANSPTNTTMKNATYNLFAADLVYGFSIGDLRIHSDPWNRVEYCAYSGTTLVGATGTLSTEQDVSGFGFRGPIQLDYSAGAFSISLPIMIMADGQSWWNNGANQYYSDLQIGAVAKINYTFNELFGVWVDVGLVSVSGAAINTNAATTNTYGGLVVPSTFGIKLTPAPVWTINLGYGYAFTLGYQVQSVSGANTNTTTYGSIPDTMYDAYGMHGYDHPFVNLSVDTKFATDWTSGLRFIVYIDNAGTGPGSGTGNNNPYINNFGNGSYGGASIGGTANGQQSSVVSGSSITYTTINNWLFFNNDGDWDNFGGSAAYLGYSKDNFSVKMYTACNSSINGSTSPYQANGGNPGSVGLLGLFGEIDVSIKF